MAFSSLESIVRGDTRPCWTLVAACVVCLLLPAVAQGGTLIISEFRLRGPNGASDEFVEIYNNSGAIHIVASVSGTGYGLAASDGVTRCTIPNGTVIPDRGYFLCVNSLGYSLASYATGNATYTTDIPDNAGIALFNNNTGGGSYALGNRFDAVGSTTEVNANYKEGTGYPAIVAFSINASFTRRVSGGCTGSGGGGTCATVALIQTTPGPASSHVQDTDNNAADFIFVDTNGTSAGAGQRLGAPGPENLDSPISRDGFGLTAWKLDSCERRDEAPNQIRDFTSNPAGNATFGTLDIRRTFTNTTGVPLARLRFRILDITTFPSISGVADLRPVTSGNVVVTVDRAPCGVGSSNIAVLGTTLEQPPSQPNGSGFNGSLAVDAISAGSPLAAGASVDVRFLLGIQQNGAARFCVAAETLPASSSQILCVIGPTNSTATFSNATAITIPASGSGASTGAPATPYPSNISVSGFNAPVTKITVTLKQISHTFPADIDVLLVGPTGVKLVLMSDTVGGFDLAGQTYTFDSHAPATLPSVPSTGPAPASGSFRPTNNGVGDLFPAPAPAGPYLSPAPAGTDSLTAFNGLNPNGTWRLYVVDDAGVDTGSIAGGWELTLTSTSPPPVTSDFDGDGKTDVAVYRPSTGFWYVRNQGSLQWGVSTDKPVAGDYNGDGKTEPAVYRPSTGEWFVHGQPTVAWGISTDIPVPGDYIGAGATNPAVYRPSTGQWFVHGQPTVAWGLSTDIPTPGDYNADLTTDIAVYRPSTGTWYVRNQFSVQWGASTDIPVPGDYNGDGTTDIAVYRPSTGTWYVRGQFSVQWGLPTDIPVPGDYNGDGTTDIAVYRASTGTWYVRSQFSVPWGLPTDIPVPRP